MAAEEQEFSFLVEPTENRGYVVSSNDGGGTICLDLEEVKTFMHSKVQDWIFDLREDEEDEDEDGS